MAFGSDLPVEAMRRLLEGTESLSIGAGACSTCDVGRSNRAITTAARQSSAMIATVIACLKRFVDISCRNVASLISRSSCLASSSIGVLLKGTPDFSPSESLESDSTRLVGKDDVAWLLVLQRETEPETPDTKEPAWVADASQADIPDRPASGRLHGSDFTVDKARLGPWSEWSGNVGDLPEKQDHADGVVLTLQAGKDSPPRNYITLFLAVKAGESVAGKTFAVPVGGPFKQSEKIMDRDGKHWLSPVGGVQLNSAEPGRKPRADLPPKVTLRVKFGKMKNNVLPGSVYLCMDDPEKSFVAGSFEATKED